MTNQQTTLTQILTMTKLTTVKIKMMDTPCPQCGADAGDKCIDLTRDDGAYDIRIYHPARHIALKMLNALAKKYYKKYRAISGRRPRTYL